MLAWEDSLATVTDISHEALPVLSVMSLDVTTDWYGGGYWIVSTASGLYKTPSVVKTVVGLGLVVPSATFPSTVNNKGVKDEWMAILCSCHVFYVYNDLIWICIL